MRNPAGGLRELCRDQSGIWGIYKDDIWDTESSGDYGSLPWRLVVMGPESGLRHLYMASVRITRPD